MQTKPLVFCGAILFYGLASLPVLADSPYVPTDSTSNGSDIGLHGPANYETDSTSNMPSNMSNDQLRIDRTAGAYPVASQSSPNLSTSQSNATSITSKSTAVKTKSKGGASVIGLTDRTAKTGIGMTDRTAKTGIGMTDRVAKTGVGLTDRGVKGVGKATKEVIKTIF